MRNFCELNMRSDSARNQLVDDVQMPKTKLIRKSSARKTRQASLNEFINSRFGDKTAESQE